MLKPDAMEMRAISYASWPLILNHEVRLVVLSVMIAIITSYTALNLAGRVILTQERRREVLCWNS
jgi:NO-binding membrane sensor protein with MHYT domain